jgi:hypothetical protein
MPIPVRRTADARRENIGKLTRGYNKAGEVAKGAAELAGEALFGEEGRIPLAASLIPGADLVDKLSAGKRPGLLDLPGLSDAKLLKALLIAGVPAEQIFKAFGKKIGQSDDVADAFAERMGRLPDVLQDATARTVIGKESGFPGYKIPPISKGNAPVPTRGGTSNNLVKGAYVNRGGANNTREMWTRGDDPDQVARTLVGLTAGRALPAELDKFTDISQAALKGVPDNGNYGRMLSDLIYGGNKKMYKDMDARGNAREVSDYLAKLYGNPNLRYVLENAEKNGEGIGELSDAFKQLSGGVPLRNNYDPSAKNAVLQEILAGRMNKSDAGDLFEKPMSNSINDFGKGLDNSYPKEDLFQLLAGGAQSGRMSALSDKFRNLGGLDKDMIQQNMVPTMMRNLSDKGSNIPMRESFDKLIKKMPIGDKDPRLTSGKSRKVRKYYFDD